MHLSTVIAEPTVERASRSMSISVTVRSVYGRETVYPACRQAEIFAQIAGTTTLTPATLELVEALGYSIEIMPAAPKSWRR